MKYANIDKNNKILGWYDKDIHTEIPTPNIEITDEQWQIAINYGHNKVNVDGSTEIFDFRTPEEIAQQIEDAKPKSITKIQAMRQLKSMNLWANLQTILASNADANDEWTLALSLEFSDPFIAQIGSALGITDMQTLFNEASLL